ncbi:NTPase [Algoriphagus aquimarinus]|uniref:NTPase n=1 Tax=Algoriphagus aquimarinus TaxID=237018 RepID=UPI0030DAF661|tara:strand:- start:142972 stop:143958 length:987 start_codon:yes stop_codon:yes gene_type:complete
MKYNILLIFILLINLQQVSAQGSLPQSFFDGKSIVFVSTDPGARPIMTWEEVADSVHHSLVQAGADPVAYFELEKVALSEAVQADYAKSFQNRLVKNIILVTRQKNQMSIHVAPFSGDGKIIPTTALFGVSAADIGATTSQFALIGQNQPSQNLLVLDVPEFLSINSSQTSSSQKFLAANPLNLDVFKLGITIEGSSAETGLLSYFRYDMYGKSPNTILAEQAAQKSGIEQVLKQSYPYQIEWLTEAKTEQELIRDRVQFLLIKVEGREADLMKSMGLEPNADPSASRIVVKYYIKLLVRDELYIGPEWDADTDWRVALNNFLENLKK